MNTYFNHLTKPFCADQPNNKRAWKFYVGARQVPLRLRAPQPPLILSDGDFWSSRDDTSNDASGSIKHRSGCCCARNRFASRDARIWRSGRRRRDRHPCRIRVPMRPVGSRSSWPKNPPWSFGSGLLPTRKALIRGWSCLSWPKSTIWIQGCSSLRRLHWRSCASSDRGPTATQHLCSQGI